MLGIPLHIKSPQLYLLYDSTESVMKGKMQEWMELEDKQMPDAMALAQQIAYFIYEMRAFEQTIEKERQDAFQFSVEELYNGFGQFDQFIHLELHRFSEAVKKFGNELGGVIVYTRQERQQLQQRTSSDAAPRTKDNIRLKIYGDYKLTNEQRADLLTSGFSCGDIYQISTAHMPLVNTFTQTGEKEIPGTINIEVDFSKMDSGRMRLHFLTKRIDNDETLLNNEWDQFWGYQLYYRPDLRKDLSALPLLCDADGKLKEQILFHQLELTIRNNQASSAETDEFTALLKKKRIARMKILAEELSKNNMKDEESLKKRHPDIYRTILISALHFEDEVISHDKALPIYWDFRSYLHIFLRHCKELQPDGHFKGKTAFVYNQKNIRRLLGISIEHLKPAITKRLSEGKDFRCANNRALYFNGNYYAMRIESNGRVDSFYPYK